MRPAPPATEGSLERAALRYLERYGGPEARLRRVLTRRAARAAEAHGAPTPQEAAHTIAVVIAKLRGLGYLDDARFARERARALRRRGKSTRAIRAALAQLGLDAETLEGAIEGDDLEAACAFVRRRRLEPGEASLAKLARAGFSYDVARRALEGALELR
ncbi:MAG: RecX family transcriptional regulator [Sandaracinaceae bacterium]|nr:RecX family transcriptional regulator [Sandaracinaceae bacterium]